VKTSFIAAAAAIIGAGLLASAPAQAEVIATAMAPNLCLDVNQQNNQVILWGCHGAANQNFFTSNYGEQRFNGLCLTGGPRGTNLHLANCNGSTDQRWTIVNDNSAPGALRNEGGWCADVFQGQAFQGQRVVTWDCKWGIDLSRANQTWIRGRFGSAASMGAPQLGSLPPGALIRGGRLVAAGAGNILGNAGSNLVAAGGGNLVAAGGGNVIAATGGGLVAAGGGN
jgi:hypothetical protein